MSHFGSAGKRRGVPGGARIALSCLAAVAILLAAESCRRDDGAGEETSAGGSAGVPAGAPATAGPTGAGKGTSRASGKDAAQTVGKNGAQTAGRDGAQTAAKGASPTAGKAATPAKASKKKGKSAEPAVPPPAVAVVEPAERLTTEQVRAEVAALRQEHAALQTRVAALTPSEPYILINTTLNRMSMKAGDRYLLQDGIVSTGSNTELIEPNGERRWFFSTPKGVHVVKRKMVAPVWTKPDWAFIEENEPVPGPQAEARFEEGTLGKYALYFGNGYMIHGTLFQRFLGQSVTHGCVRVGDADLETVYQNAKVGTKIYIY